MERHFIQMKCGNDFLRGKNKYEDQSIGRSEIGVCESGE